MLDSTNARVNLEPDGVFTLSANAGADNKLYELKLNHYDKVKVEVRIRCFPRVPNHMFQFHPFIVGDVDGC
ncbi:hypothetical protein SLEP1_g16971 [Rubroshorea leprosula]|uniref:Uncharacterized protein n=1 Tax=Rubroshorea leprosula TaxID=152421 RepID=A0AAV5IYG9_9ROSI|nr:hypothetical protein SLEP1_g16971 [Rubroshorea leprosula]